MARPTSEQPTELELKILQVLWKQHPLPVREIRDALAAVGRDLAHTSVITTLNIMVRKNYLKRNKQGNAFLFSPCETREDVSQRMLGDMVNRVFDGSASSLMLSLFDRKDLQVEDLKELRRLINRRVKEQSE